MVSAHRYHRHSRRNRPRYRTRGWLGRWIARKARMSEKGMAKLFAKVAAAKVARLVEDGQDSGAGREGSNASATGLAQPLPARPDLVKPLLLKSRDGRSLFARNAKYDDSSDEEELVYDLDEYNKKRLDKYHKDKEARREAGYEVESPEEA